MKIKTAILGGTGYTALELIRLLLRHPQAEIAAVTSRQDEGTRVSDSHPSLLGRCELLFTKFDAARLAEAGVECAFGCLPHGASMEAIPALLKEGIRVIDLSADYRLKDAAIYEEWYKEKHQDLENLQQAVYGLPELNRNAIKDAKLIANPGCYPQTAILGLAPIVKQIELQSIIIDAKSGVSGGGRTPKLSFHYPECNESVSAYGIGTHRHTPEIEQGLTMAGGENVSVIFTPHLMPMDRGILSTIYMTLKNAMSDQELFDLYSKYYSQSPFVRIRKSPPATKDVTYTNYLDIYLKNVRGRIVVVAAEDNLIRGASGVAVQNFNLMHGFEETAGLT